MKLWIEINLTDEEYNRLRAQGSVTEIVNRLIRSVLLNSPDQKESDSQKGSGPEKGVTDITVDL